MSEIGSPARLVDKLHRLIRRKLWLQILVGMGLGIGTGLLLSPSGAGVLAEETARVVACWLALPGHIFMALIQMMVVPLILSSVTLGVVSGGSPEFLKRVGLRIAPYFLGTTTVAVVLGMALATAIEPGALIDGSTLVGLDAVPVPPSEAPAPEKLLPERIAEIIPSNLTSAVLHRSMLQIVVFAILVGVALVTCLLYTSPSPRDS